MIKKVFMLPPQIGARLSHLGRAARSVLAANVANGGVYIPLILLRLSHFPDVAAFVLLDLLFIISP